jgi:adenosylcobinamide-phosphate synthase
VAEAALGYPGALYERARHPVVWIGAAIDALDRGLNRGDRRLRRASGAIALVLLLALCFALGEAAQRALLALPYGVILLGLLSSSLIAQRSLHDHVGDVVQALDVSLEQGRAALGRIVGRDVALLDEAGVARAAIESLAENFSDGIVAPALWLALLGLPGALCYKAVNTADSMIGHRTPRHEAFGFSAAKLDDLMNLPAARFAALLLAAVSGSAAKRALGAAFRDARKHASPNAGWPEAAMAGALGLTLGGPRSYGGRIVEGARLGDGHDATRADIGRALTLYRRALAALWALAALALLAARVI